MPEAFQVQGLNELRLALRDAQDKGMQRALQQANKGAAAVVADRAKKLVPVKTGRLRDSIRPLASQAKANVRAGSANVPYAEVVHWGRSSGAIGYKHGRYSKGGRAVKGRPYLWGALDAALASGDLQRTYEKSMGEITKSFYNPL